MPGNHGFQPHAQCSGDAVGAVQRGGFAAHARLDATDAPRLQPCQALELALPKASLVSDAHEPTGEVAGDAHPEMLPTGSAPVEMTGRAVQAKTSETARPGVILSPPSVSKVSGRVSELSRTRTCQATLYTAHRSDKKQQCDDRAMGERVHGVDLCWLHRKVVELGSASLEQVLDGKRKSSLETDRARSNVVGNAYMPDPSGVRPKVQRCATPKCTSAATTECKNGFARCGPCARKLAKVALAMRGR